MKRRLSGIFTCVILLLNINFLNAQVNPILGSFSLTESNGSVNINWSILTGNTCDGTRILRSEDGVSFIQIGEIVGICGSSSIEVSYSFVDDSPLKNLKSYYRLELGLSGFSHTLSIEIIEIDNKGYLVWPNPIALEGKIFFNNSKNLTHKLEVYDSDGKKVFETETKERYFAINNSFGSRGYYVFSISTSEKQVNGSFIIY